MSLLTRTIVGALDVSFVSVPTLSERPNDSKQPTQNIKLDSVLGMWNLGYDDSEEGVLTISALRTKEDRFLFTVKGELTSHDFVAIGETKVNGKRLKKDRC